MRSARPGSLTATELLIVTFHQVAERRRHRVSVNGDSGVFGITLRQLLGHAVTQFHERCQNAKLKMVGLGREIVAVVVIQSKVLESKVLFVKGIVRQRYCEVKGIGAHMVCI